MNMPKGIKIIGENPRLSTCLNCAIAVARRAKHISPTMPNQNDMNIRTKIWGLIFIFISVPLKPFEMRPVIIGRNEFR